MDELKARLKRDAEQIDARLAPDLEVRIDAALHAARERTSVSGRRPASGHSISGANWLFASLTGMAAALLLIVIMNWNGQEEPGTSGLVVENEASDEERSLPLDWNVSESLSLQIRPADLTSPLEKELENLRSDLEKARENVERDVKFSF